MALLKGTQDDDLTLKYLLQNASGGGSADNGLPQGGTTGQVLSKKSNDDYDTEWSTPSAGSVTDVEVYGDSVVTDGVAEIPDTIHVGASAPADPKTKIWLDTDEQGVSVVTSVNGQSGAVTLPFLTMELLWTNPSPSSAFSAQTISIDLSDYSFLVIKAARSNSSAVYVSTMVAIDGTEAIILGGANAGLNLTGRSVTATASSIVFSAGYLQGNSGTSTSWCIPVTIYGVRGTLL